MALSFTLQMFITWKYYRKSYQNIKKIPSFTYEKPSLFLSLGETLFQNCLSLSDPRPVHSFSPQGFLIFSNFLGLSYA